MQGKLISFWKNEHYEMYALSQTPNFTLWNFRTKKDLREIFNNNFFGFSTGYVNIGDIIIVNAINGTAQVIVTDIKDSEICVKCMGKCLY